MDRKNNTRKQLIISIAIVLFLIVVAVPAYRFVRDTNEFKKRQESGEFDNYHHQPANEFEAPVVYYKSDLERIVGVDLRETETELAGVSCMRYWNNRNVPTEYDDLRFYVFDKEKDAVKALKTLKKNKNHWSEITDEGDNYIRGWEAGTIDADVEMYYYRNGNLIVETCVTCVDESARPVDDPTPAVIGGGYEALNLIRLINNNF